MRDFNFTYGAKGTKINHLTRIILIVNTTGVEC